MDIDAHVYDMSNACQNKMAGGKRIIKFNYLPTRTEANGGRVNSFIHLHNVFFHKIALMVHSMHQTYTFLC